MAIASAALSTMSTIRSMDELDRGVTLGHQYMNEALAYLEKVEVGKKRIKNGEVLSLGELSNLYDAAKSARTLGVMGSQIATVASTMGREDFGDVATAHLGTIISVTLNMASAIHSSVKTSALFKAAWKAEDAKGWQLGSHSQQIFQSAFEAYDVPRNVITSLLGNADLMRKINEAITAVGMVKDGASMFLGGPLADIPEGQSGESNEKSPIFDDELLAIYEQLFGADYEKVIGEVPIDQTFPMPSYGQFKDRKDAFSGGRTDLGDITVESEVGDVTVINKTRKDLEVNIHSIEAKGNVKSGDITLKGHGNDITVIKKSRKSEAEVNIGSVVVGE